MLPNRGEMLPGEAGLIHFVGPFGDRVARDAFLSKVQPKIGSRSGEIAMQNAGSGPDSPSTAIPPTLPVTAGGHSGNLGLEYVGV